MLCLHSYFYNVLKPKLKLNFFWIPFPPNFFSAPTKHQKNKSRKIFFLTLLTKNIYSYFTLLIFSYYHQLKKRKKEKKRKNQNPHYHHRLHLNTLQPLKPTFPNQYCNESHPKTPFSVTIAITKDHFHQILIQYTKKSK